MLPLKSRAVPPRPIPEEALAQELPYAGEPGRKRLECPDKSQTPQYSWSHSSKRRKYPHIGYLLTMILGSYLTLDYWDPLERVLNWRFIA